MRLFTLGAYMIFMSSLTLAGQGQPPQFSVASVKPDPENGPYPQLRVGPKGFSAAEPLIFFLRYAYQVTEVSGAPDWAWGNVFDVDARSETAASPEEMRSMLRTLLGERFGVRAHIEARLLSGYALLVKGARPKLKPHVDGEAGAPRPPILIGAQFILGNGASMKQLATALTSKLGVPVEDDTRFDGVFDFTVSFDPGTPPPSLSNQEAETATAVGASGGVRPLPINLADLGLKIVTKKLNRPVLIVDAASRPSVN